MASLPYLSPEGSWASPVFTTFLVELGVRGGTLYRVLATGLPTCFYGVLLTWH